VTLGIAAVSSVIAAIVVSKVWAGGTLVATAMTPVIVTLVKEALERPAQRLDVGVSRLTAVRREAGPDALVVEEVEPGPQAELSEMKVYSARGHKWKIALVTGLLAAVVALAALTLPELVAGHSILSGGKRTTAFGGSSGNTTKTKQPTTTATTTTTQTVTQTVPSNTQTTPTVTQTTPTQTTTTPTTTQTTPTAPSGGQTTTVPPAQTTTPQP
jgi:hypothetical protein